MSSIRTFATERVAELHAFGLRRPGVVPTEATCALRTRPRRAEGCVQQSAGPRGTCVPAVPWAGLLP
jgi:hypothetical protein